MRDLAGTHNRRVGLLGLVVVAVALLCAGCGGTSLKGRLASRLLIPTDLPTGWRSTSTADSGKPGNAPCLAKLASHPQGVTYATAGFVQGSVLPGAGEALAGGPAVRGLWRRAEAALSLCHTVQLKLAHTTVTSQIRPLALPRVGDSSAAYAWSFTASGIRIGFDLVLFTVGSYGGEVVYSDLGPPPQSAVLAFARAAAQKARTGSTPAIPGSVSVTSAPVQTVGTADGTVGYRVIGTGPPLVMIMGYGGTMEVWDRRFVDALAQHRRVVVFDNGGIGQTSALPSPLTIDAMANQTSALISALKLGRPDVLGWSMGSMIAQALAVLHPSQVDHLVLCASSPGDGTAVWPSQAAISALKSSSPTAVLADLFPADQTAAGESYSAALTAYPSAATAPAGVVSAQAAAVRGWWNGHDAAGRRAGSITAPTLIADGTEDRLDPLADSRRLAQLIPGSTLKLYPDAGHAFLFQDEASFLPTVESFLGS